MKIFYSWQEDTDLSTCKSLIREALEIASKKVSDDLEIDHDTKRVLGSPNIVEIIARKIRGASVFIADVTLTGKTCKPDGKKKMQINSNVAIELGYALGTHGDEVVVKVMNDHYGTPEDLPFDVRDRHPVRFTLAPSGNKLEKKHARDQLSAQFENILSEHYAHWQSSPSQQPEKTPFTLNRAAYWDNSGPLIDALDTHGNRLRLEYDDTKPIVYLRLSPNNKLPELSKNDQVNSLWSSNPPVFFGTTGGINIERNRYGAIVFASMGKEKIHGGTTQLFKTGEVWGVASIIFSYDKENNLYLPSKDFEEYFNKSLEEYVKLAQAIGYKSAYVEAGLMNLTVAPVYLGVSDYGALDRYYFHNDFYYENTIDLNKDNDISVFSNGFMDKVYDEAGAQR